MGHPEEPDQTPCLGSPEAPEWDPQSVPFPRPALRRSLCCYLPRFGLNLRCAPRPPPPASFCQSCTDMQTCTEQPSSCVPQVASPALPCALASPCSSAESVNRGWWLSSSMCICAQSERGFAPAPPVPHATCSPDVGWQYSLGMACCVSLCLCVSTAVGSVGYMSGGGPGWARGSQEGLPGTEDPGPQHTTCPITTQLPAAQACVGPGHRWACVPTKPSPGRGSVSRGQGAVGPSGPWCPVWVGPGPAGGPVPGARGAATGGRRRARQSACCGRWPC